MADRTPAVSSVASVPWGLTPAAGNISRTRSIVMTAQTRPDEPNFCFAPAYDVETDLQKIRIVIKALPRPHRARHSPSRRCSRLLRQAESKARLRSRGLDHHGRCLYASRGRRPGKPRFALLHRCPSLTITESRFHRTTLIVPPYRSSTLSRQDRNLPFLFHCAANALPAPQPDADGGMNPVLLLVEFPVFLWPAPCLALPILQIQSLRIEHSIVLE